MGPSDPLVAGPKTAQRSNEAVRGDSSVGLGVMDTTLKVVLNSEVMALDEQRETGSVDVRLDGSAVMDLRWLRNAVTFC